jgi:hypothetical protein
LVSAGGVNLGLGLANGYTLITILGGSLFGVGGAVVASGVAIGRVTQRSRGRSTS